MLCNILYMLHLFCYVTKVVHNIICMLYNISQPSRCTRGLSTRGQTLEADRRRVRRPGMGPGGQSGWGAPRPLASSRALARPVPLQTLGLSASGRTTAADQNWNLSTP